MLSRKAFDPEPEQRFSITQMSSRGHAVAIDDRRITEERTSDDDPARSEYIDLVLARMRARAKGAVA